MKQTMAPSMNLAESYDQVATDYAERIFNELSGKPKDRELLNQFGQLVGSKGKICDLGCGPGQVARYLSDQGYENIFGIDLSPGMIEQARRLSPEIRFVQGDMLSLDISDDSLGGIAAFYSIIHIPREKLGSCFKELARVLRPDGVLLFSFHIGKETIHLDEWWGKKVSADFHFFESGEMIGYLKSTGFEVVDLIERDPYDSSIEHQSRRAYIFAKKPVPIAL